MINQKAVLGKLVLLLALIIVNSIRGLSQDTIQNIVPNRKNNPEQTTKPYLILISADGFRYDYADKYNAVNLKRLRSSGVQAKSMKPSYPSVTFPNHYTVATGMYPSHHGLVYNQFYDRQRKESYSMSDRKAVEDGSWYGGTPIWVLAEQKAMVTASYHFVGTESPIQGVYPTYWYKFDDKTDIDYRIQKVVDWLTLPDSIRPHLICFYMSNADHQGHMYGPDSKETEEAVQFIDAAIGRMVEKVGTLGLPVNYVFLADHGMANVDTVTRINIASMIDTSKIILRGGSTSLHLYARNADDIQPTYQLLENQEENFRVYLRKDIPTAWHFNTKEDRFNRIGDIFVCPVYPKVLSSWKGSISPGAHGFDPALQEMHATFYAWGPNFKSGKKINTFENVHVYPLMCAILGLRYEHEIDGKLGVWKKVVVGKSKIKSKK